MSSESNQFRLLLRLLHDDWLHDDIKMNELINKTRASTLPGSVTRESTLQMEDSYEDTYQSQGF